MILFFNHKKEQQEGGGGGMMIFRQGDILITKVNSNNVDHSKYAIIPDSKTVALGEITGHHHTFNEQSQVLLFKEKDKKSATSDDPTLIQVQSEMAELEHQEHNTILLPQGTYKITREVEYNPFTLEIKRTQD